MTKETTTSSSDQSESRVAKFFDIFLLGITIVVGGQPFGWNFGMNSTFVEFICATVIMGLSYLFLTFCVGEMISALPFSGGLYAFARVALSPYAGFIVGLLEILHNAFTLASGIYPIAQAITFNTGADDKYEPLYWLIVIIFSLYGNVVGGHTFWFFNKYMALGCIFVIILYFFTPTVNPTDFNKYALSNLSGERDHNFNIEKFFQYLPMSIWVYLGIELVPFASAYTIKPSHTIPRAMIASLAAIFTSSLLIMFISCSQAPGTGGLAESFFPLTPGFSRFLNISPKAADWFSIPMMVPSIFGFLFGGGRQIWALSTSGLLPSFLKITTAKTEAPYVALLVEAVFVYLVMLVIKFGCDGNTMLLFYLYVLNSAVVYLTTFITFIAFRAKYSNIKRHFVSPLGNYGAYAGILINIACIGSVLGLQVGTDFVVAPVSLAIFLILGSIYYFAYATNRQTFSPEEQKAFFITYIINSNSRNKKKPKTYSAHSNVSTNRNRENSQSNRSNHSSEKKSISFENFDMPNTKSKYEDLESTSIQFNQNLQDNDGLIDFDKIADTVNSVETSVKGQVLEEEKVKPEKESLFPIHEHPIESSRSHLPGSSFLGGSLFTTSLKKLLPVGSHKIHHDQIDETPHAHAEIMKGSTPIPEQSV